MKPYYQDEAVTIYCADYRDVADHGPMDLVLTDPPYNATNIGKNARQYESWKPMEPKQYKVFCKEWFDHAMSLSERLIFTPGIVNIWNYPPATWIMCWHKPGGVAYTKLGNLNVWEPILIYGKPKHKWHGLDIITKVPLNFKTWAVKKHPCPKPEAVWDWLILNMTDSRDMIYDPFLGSGTTAWCAKKLGRRCIGVEIEEKYCEIAADRCRQQVLM